MDYTQTGPDQGICPIVTVSWPRVHAFLKTSMKVTSVGIYAGQMDVDLHFGLDHYPNHYPSLRHRSSVESSGGSTRTGVSSDSK